MYNKKMDKCDSIDLLKSNNIKATSQRVSVLNEIIKKKRPFNANELYDILKDQIDLATIYRVFIVFKKAGIIREAAYRDDVLYYELSCVHHPVHPHFICDRCKSIICLDALQIKDTKALSVYAGELYIREVSINISGLCRQCNKKN